MSDAIIVPAMPLSALEDAINAAIRAAFAAGIPQGLIVATLHGIALQQTQVMIDG